MSSAGEAEATHCEIKKKGCSIQNEISQYV